MKYVRMAFLFTMIYLVISGSVAAAESVSCWTCADEKFYHFDEQCGDGDVVRFTMSVSAAESFGKKPCPLCTEADAADSGMKEMPEISVSERGGTFVFLIPAEYVEGCEVRSEGKDDAEIGRLVSDYLQTSEAPLDGRIPIPDDRDLLLMCLREVNNDWVLIVRPEKPFTGKDPFRWRVITTDYTFGGNGRNLVSGTSEWITHKSLNTESDYEKVFEAEYKFGDIAVYRTLGCNIAVLHMKDSHDSLKTRKFLVEGSLDGLPMDGYKREKTTVYCCVLTDSELGALVAGVVPQITDIGFTGEQDEDSTVPDISDDALGIVWDESLAG